MYTRVTAQQATLVRKLESRLGDQLLRQILTPKSGRIMRPERLRNLEAGRGRLTPQEAVWLESASSNANQIEGLKRRGKNKRGQFRVNRAIRDWLHTGKSKDTDYHKQDSETRQKQIEGAVKALRFLGVDPADGTFYVKKRSG